MLKKPLPKEKMLKIKENLIKEYKNRKNKAEAVRNLEGETAESLQQAYEYY